MDNATLINQLTDEVNNLFHIYQALAAHIESGSTLSQEVRELGNTIQRLDRHVQTLSRQIGLNQSQNAQPGTDKTYTVTYSDEGWRVHFQPNVAPYFGLEPRYSLRQVIERVEDLYPEYRSRLTSSQLEDYVRELNDLVDIHGYETSVPNAVTGLMRCAPPDMPASKRIALQEDAKSAFETGVGLPHVIKELGSQQQKKPQFSQDHRKELNL